MASDNTNLEIERRFFPAPGSNKEELKEALVKTLFIKQYYLCSDSNATVRLRSSTEDHKAFLNTLTLKGKKVGASCSEVELPVSSSKCEDLLMLARTSLTKVRQIFYVNGYNFEWDTFDFRIDHGPSPLEIIEVEFSSSEEAAKFDPTSWPFLGKEVTDDRSLSNKNLALPYEHLWDPRISKE